MEIGRVEIDHKKIDKIRGIMDKLKGKKKPAWKFRRALLFL